MTWTGVCNVYLSKKKKKECARYDMYSSSHLCPYYNLELGESFKAKLDKSN